jgi:histidine triad (HIT) family protein
MQDPHCIFCKIITKEIPAEIVHEDEFSLSFLDINPVNYGHLLVIPKEHYVSIANTPDELVGKLFIRAKELMSAVQKGTGADFVALSIVGVDVPHFHIHLVPRFRNDGLAGFWPTKKYSPRDKITTTAEEIKRQI